MNQLCIVTALGDPCYWDSNERRFIRVFRGRAATVLPKSEAQRRVRASQRRLKRVGHVGYRIVPCTIE